jgi:hypothetical protein
VQKTLENQEEDFMGKLNAVEEEFRGWLDDLALYDADEDTDEDEDEDTDQVQDGSFLQGTTAPPTDHLAGN